MSILFFVMLASSVMLAAAMAWAAAVVARSLKGLQDETARGRQAQLLAFLAPALARVREDPAALVDWHRAADVTRALFPEDAAALDRAAGNRYPFTPADVQDAHARWSSAWLAWERANDIAYKTRLATLQSETARAGEAVPRITLEALEQERLDVYQRRYADYVRVSKALQALL